MLRVLNVHCFDAVENQDQMRAFGDDVVGVPLPSSPESDGWLDQIRDRAGAVGGALIIDVRLVTIIDTDILRIGATDEDAAIRIVRDPEFGMNLEIGVRILGDEITHAACRATQLD